MSWPCWQNFQRIGSYSIMGTKEGLRVMGRQSGQMRMIVPDLSELIPQIICFEKAIRWFLFDFIYDFVALYYPATGLPSVDHTSIFKILLVGYLYGAQLECRLVQEVQSIIAYRWLCGFELIDQIPDYSIFRKTRVRKCGIRVACFKRCYRRLSDTAYRVA